MHEASSCLAPFKNTNFFSKVHVLTQEGKDGIIKVWNPATGVSFEIDDEFCPLQNIGLLVSQKVGMVLLCNHPILISHNLL